MSQSVAKASVKPKLTPALASKLMVSVSATLWTELGSREAFLQSCRDAHAAGVPQSDIERRVYLTGIAKALAAKGADFAEDMLAEADRVSKLGGIDTKLPDDQKCNEQQHLARQAGRGALSRAIASLGWISTRTKTGAPPAENKVKVAASQAAAQGKVTVSELRVAVPKFKDANAAKSWHENLAMALETCQKQNAALIPAPVASRAADLIKAIREEFKA